MVDTGQRVVLAYGCGLALALCASGCTPRREEVLAWNSGLLSKLRERLNKSAGSLPPVGQASLFAAHALADPRPLLSPRLDNRVNTDVVAVDDITGARASAVLPVAGYHLGRILRLMEPGEGDRAALAERDPAFRDEIKHVLALRYALIVRAATASHPSDLGEAFTVEAFLVDIATGSIRGAVTSTVHRGRVLQDLKPGLVQAFGGDFL